MNHSLQAHAHSTDPLSEIPINGLVICPVYPCVFLLFQHIISNTSAANPNFSPTAAERLVNTSAIFHPKRVSQSPDIEHPFSFQSVVKWK